MVESVTGKEYDAFFRQWFHEAGHPVLSFEWKKKGRSIELNIRQHQEQYIFQFPIDIEIKGKKGGRLRKTVEMDAREKSMIIEIPFKAKDVLPDPDTWLLYELYQGT